MDELNRKILKILSSNSRITNNEIALKTGKSEATIRRRIKELIERGVIRKFTIDLPPEIKNTIVPSRPVLLFLTINSKIEDLNLEHLSKKIKHVLEEYSEIRKDNIKIWKSIRGSIPANMESMQNKESKKNKENKENKENSNQTKPHTKGDSWNLVVYFEILEAKLKKPKIDEIESNICSTILSFEVIEKCSSVQVARLL
ncbi:MAG: Lrp/AsnC family transcriptional regulator [Promethearchaeota archaeon]